jgi:hypothetical protein
MDPENRASDNDWTRIDVPSGRDVRYAEVLEIEVDDEGEIHYRPGKLTDNYKPGRLIPCGNPFIEAEVRRKKRRAFWRRLLARFGLRL